ncbi:hypothetical protein chiPu_0023510 [Chiloscyllium punctatum]|uniref:Uncharacterized protein n=1 Tax=Chiloscyllium punctatum TaxID=137246 RepID=A0A401TBF6_CHIPU|nr:hypothetical protein [Chiloscyllium punctatum]
MTSRCFFGLPGKASRHELSEMRARLYLNLGFLYDSLKEPEKCNHYIRKSVFIAENLKDVTCNDAKFLRDQISLPVSKLVQLLLKEHRVGAQHTVDSNTFPMLCPVCSCPYTL